MINKLKNNLVPNTPTDWIMFIGMLVSILSITTYLVNEKIAEYGIILAIALITGGAVFEFTTRFTKKDNNEGTKVKD